MAALTFTLKKTPHFKLNCGRLTPNLLTGLTLEKIKSISLTSSKNSPKVIDFFEVSGDDAQHIIFNNCTSQLDYIGHKMTQGAITTEGNTGDFLGANMQNGTIICHGNASDRVGDQMRRGLILIDGNAGDYSGSRMIAGTIGIFGKVGSYTSFGMKRGTILLMHPPVLHATLQDCGTHTLPFLALLLKSFQSLNSTFASIHSQRVQRYAGDLACNGNGEILVFQES